MAAAKGNDYTLKRKECPQYTDEQIDVLANDLIQWAETAKDIHIAGWSRKHKKTTPWLHELAKTHKKMAEAKAEAMILLGKKVLNASFYGEGNATVGLSYLPIYDKDFKAMLQWKEDIKKKEISEKEAQIIVQAVNYSKKEIDKEEEKQTESK